MCQDNLHYPLVRIAGLQEISPEEMKRNYMVVLQNRNCIQATGRLSCDFQDATICFFQPGEWTSAMKSLDCPEDASVLYFNPGLFGYALPSCDFSVFTYFQYKIEESLHISRKEMETLECCLYGIKEEMDWGIDKYSWMIITERIKLFLDYCLRFYERQFFIRCHIYDEIMADLDKSIDKHILSGCLCLSNPALLTGYFAAQNKMSVPFFNDMVLHETGVALPCLIEMRQIDFAKDKLKNTDETLLEIVRELGFPSLNHFCRLFKKCEGCTPEQYREEK